MRNARPSLHDRVHNWIDTIGFRLNSSQTNRRDDVVTNHYFFKTFNLFERAKKSEPGKAKFVCFDTYGEKIQVRSLLDIQAAFFENISQLK